MSIQKYATGQLIPAPEVPETTDAAPQQRTAAREADYRCGCAADAEPEGS